MTVKDNAYTQQVTADAIAILTAHIAVTSDEFQRAKFELLKAMLVMFRLNSNSGNGIPSFGGLGLDEAVKFSEKIIELGNVNPQFVSFFRFDSMFNTVSLTR